MQRESQGTMEEGPRVGEARARGLQMPMAQLPRSGNPRWPVPRAGWDDLPGELHREILRLVPLSDATAARAVSREMRDEVDEVWRAWGIRATKGGGRNAICERLHDRRKMTELDFGPLVVHA